jgi:hypothetical protein
MPDRDQDPDYMIDLPDEDMEDIDTNLSENEQ